MLHTLATSSRRRLAGAPMLCAAIALAAFAGLAALAAAADAGASGVSAGRVACPLRASSVAPSGEAWAFTETGPPSAPHRGIASSYTHGRGSWGGGRGSGTICNQDSAPGRPSREVVLAVGGPATISPRITRDGRLGVGLALRVTVSSSDDPGCPPASRGMVTLFASYFEEHHDSVQLRFTGACSAYDLTFAGTQLHVLIANDGRQVNSA
jgi:hypothetical protein